MSNYILVINPGSTSTKIGVFENDTLLFDKTLRHPAEEIAKFATIPDQKSWRKDLVELTEQGHTMAKIWRGNYQKMEEIMLKGFSDQERAQFADYLIRAYHNFREREEEPLCKI